MSEYIHGSGWTWNQYLQMKSFEDGIRWDIRDSALKVSGSLDALKDSGVRVEKAVGSASKAIQGAVRAEGAATRETLDSGFSRVETGLESGFSQVNEGLGRIDQSLERVEDTLHAGFVRLHFDLEDVQASLTDMSAKFDYGFSQLSNQLGSINDTLEQLKVIAKTPEQTWAFEQFAIAREAVQRGLFEEALIYVTRAIDGHQSHTGFLLEHRFHHFLGTLRQGDLLNRTGGVVDLALAEKSFVNAARYARVTHKEDAGRSLCCAGHAAIWQGNVPLALQHTEAALELHPGLPEAHYQRARLKFHVEDVKGALPSLKRAIELDPLYSLKCLRNDSEEFDFVKHESEIVSLIIGMRDERLKRTVIDCDRAKQIALRLKTEAASRLSSLTEKSRSFVAQTPGSTYSLVLPDISGRFDTCAKQLAKIAEICMKPMPYLDALNAYESGVQGTATVVSTATSSRSTLAGVSSQVRTSQPSVALERVAMPSESEIDAAKNRTNYILPIFRVLFCFGPYLALAAYTGLNSPLAIGFGFWAGIAAYFVAGWLFGRYGVFDQAAQNSRVNALHRAAKSREKNATQRLAVETKNRDDIVAKNEKFDRDVKAALAELIKLIEGGEKELTR
jgi:tetratricopeptide (TPR) repeat protein